MFHLYTIGHANSMLTRYARNMNIGRYADPPGGSAADELQINTKQLQNGLRP
jgi:hypothetical protein